MSHLTRSIAAGAATVVLTLAACAEPPVAASHATMHGDAAPHLAKLSSSGLRDIRAGTARYHSTDQATAAGYAQSSPCVAVPGLGGMGFHWVNGSLIDPVFDPLSPEAVLYAPNSDGELKLVGVEYIVIDVGQPRPTLDGQPFDIGGTPVPAPHYSLHVWVHRENPNGVFTPFNPSVSCATN